MSLSYLQQWKQQIQVGLYSEDPIPAISMLIATLATVIIWILTFLTVTAVVFWIVLLASSF